LSSAHVNFCEADEAAALAKVGFLERLGYQYHWRNTSFSSFDDYLAQLKSKRRYAVRHERSALDAQGVRVEAMIGDEIPSRVLARMFDVYRSTVDKLYWGRRYLTREFFELAARDF